MIPRSLHLANFLSYGEMAEPIDFSGVSLACLSGPNGHGKSALLDAMTWAIWGRARGSEGGQDQEQLIRDGADATRVEFVFSLEDQTYRISRTRWRTGKGDVSFTIRAPDGSWTDLAGEGIADTQRRIIDRLRMDYETFVASAFILQGRADTFTRLEPHERKGVLGKILGLEVYEQLAARAKERRKEAQAEAEGHASALEILERDLAARDEHTRAADAAAGELSAAERDRDEADRAVRALEERLSALRVVEATAEEARKRRDAAQATVRHEEAELTALEAKAAELAAAATPDPKAAAAAAGLSDLEREESRLEQARTRHEELSAEAASLEGRIREERSRLQTERVHHVKQAEKLEKSLAVESDARRLLVQADATLASLESAEARREALLRRHSEIRERVGALEAERGVRERERAETKEKVALLDQAGAGCPVCGERLTPSHRKEVRASFTAAVRALDAADKAASKEERALAAEAKDVEREGRELRATLTQRDEIAGKAAALRAQLEGLDAARAELERERASSAEIAALLEADDYAVPERNKLARVREELDACAFSREEYRSLKAALDAARRADRALASAREAEAALVVTRRAVTQTNAGLERARAAHAGAVRDLEEMGERIEEIPAAVAELDAARTARGEGQRRVEAAHATLATSTQALELLERKNDEAVALRVQLSSVKRRAGMYEKLSRAFGRDGIPARIVGNAIPELRIEANRLLGLLTDGQLSVSIDPVKETKSRGPKETLEVTVYDAAGGKRAYEMYSGGERLRIDFALRVALSRLLATRAGARLETLVIDEGFGSQDAEGRRRLLDAIIKVRGEFATVLVITHLDELKEQFPTRLEVRKDPLTGSSVTRL